MRAQFMLLLWVGMAAAALGAGNAVAGAKAGVAAVRSYLVENLRLAEAIGIVRNSVTATASRAYLAEKVPGLNCEFSSVPNNVKAMHRCRIVEPTSSIVGYMVLFRGGRLLEVRAEFKKTHPQAGAYVDWLAAADHVAKDGADGSSVWFFDSATGEQLDPGGVATISLEKNRSIDDQFTWTLVLVPTVETLAAGMPAVESARPQCPSCVQLEVVGFTAKLPVGWKYTVETIRGQRIDQLRKEGGAQPLKVLLNRYGSMTCAEWEKAMAATPLKPGKVGGLPPAGWHETLLTRETASIAEVNACHEVGGAILLGTVAITGSLAQIDKSSVHALLEAIGRAAKQ